MEVTEKSSEIIKELPRETKHQDKAKSHPGVEVMPKRLPTCSLESCSDDTQVHSESRGRGTSPTGSPTSHLDICNNFFTVHLIFLSHPYQIALPKILLYITLLLKNCRDSTILLSWVHFLFAFTKFLSQVFKTWFHKPLQSCSSRFLSVGQLQL